MPRNPAVTGAIIGLGNIGFGFNADRKRRGVWTHERAFARSGAVRLTAAADPDVGMRARFARARPEVPVYESAEEMLRRHRPELVSICAPTRFHAGLVRTAVSAGAKAVFCEKPVAATSSQAREILSLCRRAKIPLAVNHTRRWDPAFRRAAAAIRRGRIGRPRSVSVRYTAEVYNVGTHVIDAVRMITGLDPEEAVGFTTAGAPDPSVSGVLTLSGGVACVLACHGASRDLIVEIDVVGSEGRLRLLENGKKTVLERFASSRRYGGYRELRPEGLPAAAGGDRFVAAVRELAACARGARRPPSCSGRDGYLALAAAEALAASARSGGKLVKIDSKGI